MLMRIIVCKPT